MRRVLEVCLALVLAGVAWPAQGAPFAGTWEGRSEGVKAVILDIRIVGGAIAGDATFYILKSIDGADPGGAATRVAMERVRTHDSVLEFDVTTPDGDTVHFSMALDSRDTAKLERAPGEKAPALSIGLRRVIAV